MSQIGAGYFFSFIDSIDAIDNQHVAIRLNTPLTYDHVALIQYQGIMPEHYWRDRDPTKHTLEPPIYSGPYRVKDGITAREDYWGWH